MKDGSTLMAITYDTTTSSDETMQAAERYPEDRE